jgi:alkanesulfonate monooxygenase SsuD/methylene tetrahydromethanopterin reductase-like flavin-dependent oxidoreductase (luciferase family)
LLPVPRPAGTVPLWVGSWGSAAGLRRVARLGDGWLAVEEVRSGDWGIAGKPLTTQDVRALAAAPA